MYKKKRGQVTIYIILGIIILASAVIYFYFKGSSYQQISEEEIIKAQNIPKEARPVTNYVTTQLDDATKQGLYLIGMQGGYIYEKQGGVIPDPEEQGKDFVFYDEHNISYCINKETETISNYFIPEPRYYPWALYPYRSKKTLGKKEIFAGFFGKSNLPELEGPMPSIKSQMEEYIVNYLEQNIDFGIFGNQGFNISEGKMNVSFIITENEVISLLEYPLGIEKKTIGMKTNVTYFYSNPKIRLKKIYNLTDFAINKDITHILYDIDSIENDGDGIGINKEKNVYKDDDIITVYDNKSLLYTEPYEFRFARENRYPALRYVYVAKFEFPGIQSIMNAVITEEEVKKQLNPLGDDSDEDEIIFKYSPEIPYRIKQPEFDEGEVEIRIYACEKDNINICDYQDLKLDISGVS